MDIEYSNTWAHEGFHNNHHHHLPPGRCEDRSNLSSTLPSQERGLSKGITVIIITTIMVTTIMVIILILCYHICHVVKSTRLGWVGIYSTYMQWV